MGSFIQLLLFEYPFRIVLYFFYQLVQLYYISRLSLKKT